MNTQKKWGLVIVLVGLILLGLLIYWTFFRGDQEPVDTPVTLEPEIGGQLPSLTESEVTPGDRPRNPQTYDISQEAAYTEGVNEISRFAMSFAERFGSFSSQSNFSNITDLQMFMTSSMRQWSVGYIDRLREENPSSTYYGISTYALSSETISFNEDAGQAEIRIFTQRRENRDDQPGENLFLQNLRLELMQQANDWKVNAAYWEDR